MRMMSKPIPVGMRCGVSPLRSGVTTIDINDHGLLSEAELRGWHDVVSASAAHDHPDSVAPSPQLLRARLVTSRSYRRRSLWLATEAGKVVGVAGLRLFEAPAQSHLSQLDLDVHPGRRREGVGSRLLAAALAEARADGRSRMICEIGHDDDSHGFAVRHHFAKVLTIHRLLLDMSVGNDGRWEEIAGAAPSGYRPIDWQGVVADEWAAAFAAAKNGMSAAPTGGMDFGAVSWDAARVVQLGRNRVDQGETPLTVAAVRNGEIAGYTELVIPAGDAHRAVQYDTVVLPDHRGNGIGLWLKAVMLRRLRGDFPHITQVETGNADTNLHMRAVNERLGFRQVRSTHQYQCDLTR